MMWHAMQPVAANALLNGTCMNNLSLTVLIVVSIFSNAALAKPPDKDRYLAKMRGTPDLVQTLEAAKFPGHGKKYCAPVAVSNSLMWLGNRGYPKLLSQSQRNAKDNQIEMVHNLASPEMMNTRPNTGPKAGTSVGGLLRGIRKYVESCGYTCKTLGCQGWRNVPKQYTPETQVPDLEWTKSALANNRAVVWWNVGWYQAGKQPGEYERIGGHWLTVVGYRENKRNRNSPGVFILHDPAPRAGKTPARENVLLEKIETGSLVGKNKGLPRSAVGYYMVGGGMHIKKTADFAILDCSVALELAPK